MRTIIPFGPQHPVLAEPIHLKLVMEDEKIQEVVPALGFVHRGLEALVSQRDFHQMIQVVERVCGICSMIHAMCFCQGIERLMGIEVPPRARYLRVIWSELERIHSHLLWLGLLADSMGFESLFMQTWQVREKILDIHEATAGNRIIVSVNTVGGIRRDISRSSLDWILSQLAEVKARVKEIGPTLLEDYTVKKRTTGKGVVPRDQAWELGLAGPTLRASGVAQDLRMLRYEAFSDLDFEPVTETDGDAHARCRVRYREIFQSIDLICQAIVKIPDSEIRAKVKGRPEGEILVRVEQPRGELVYYIKADGGKHLERLRIRTPTFANLPALLFMLPGHWLSDVPVILMSIDPCISCTER